MVNRRRKGLVTMRKAREYGENLGYEIEQALHTKFKADYFNMFDQMWLRKERLIFVQIKTNQSIGKSMQKTFEDWSREHNLETMIMNWNEKKEEWVIRRFALIKVDDILKDVFISKEVR